MCLTGDSSPGLERRGIPKLRCSLGLEADGSRGEPHSELLSSESCAIHHPTRLSVGPAWLTAAIYLNVIGSKLARGRAARKEAATGRGLLGNFPEASSQPQPRRGAVISREVLSVVLNPTCPFLFLPGDKEGRGGGVL